VTLINDYMPGHPLASIVAVVRAGSRDETAATAGLFHFLEHMFFKGTTKYSSARALGRAIHLLGADTNAFTSPEQTGFIIVGLAQHTDAMAGLMANMLTDPLLSRAEMEKERNVILMEIAGAGTSPDEWVMDNIGRSAFGGGQPISWPVFGTPDVVKSVSRDDLLAFRGNRYHPKQMALSVAGGRMLSSSRAEELLRNLQPDGPDHPRSPAIWGQGPQTLFREFATGPGEDGQCVFSVALPGISIRDDDWRAMRVMSMIFGGGESWSRLFLRIRDESGLVYGVHGENSSFEDTGVFSIDMACRPDDAARATRMAFDELRQMALEGPTAEEMTIAQARIRTSAYGGYHSPPDRAHAAAVFWSFGLRLKSAEQRVAEFQSVTADDVRRMAANLVNRLGDARVVLAGPEDRSAEILAAVDRPAKPRGAFIGSAADLVGTARAAVARARTPGGGGVVGPG